MQMRKHYKAVKVGGRPDYTWELNSELNKQLAALDKERIIIERIDLVTVMGWSAERHKYEMCPEYIITYYIIEEEEKPFAPDPLFE